MSDPAAQTVHASCVAIDGRGILVAGRSGAGKSDLALRLIDRGARLVSDDYTVLRADEGALIASPPPNIAGKMEVRGIGILDLSFTAGIQVCLFVDLDAEPARMPEQDSVMLAGIALPSVALNALEPSAPIKVEMALARFGLEPENARQP